MKTALDTVTTALAGAFLLAGNMDLFDAVKDAIMTRDSAEKLAADFNIDYDRHAPKKDHQTVSPVTARRSLIQRLRNYQNENYRALCSYRHLLEDWKRQYGPKPEDEKWHPLFSEALQNQDRVDYLLDELVGCTADEAKELVAVHKNEIAQYASRVKEFRPRPTRGAKETVR